MTVAQRSGWPCSTGRHLPVAASIRCWLHAKGSSHCPRFLPWGRHVSGNASGGWCNSSWAAQVWCQLQSPTGPLPAHQAPEALFQLQHSARAEQESLPCLGHLLAALDKLFVARLLWAQITVTCLPSIFDGLLNKFFGC